MKTLLTALLFSFLASSVSAQQFVNGDLEDSFIGLSQLPAGWQAVNHTDWFCNANTSTGATPDLTDTQGPDAVEGISGQAFTGATFVSGLDCSVMNWDFHEGIQQELGGLVPNVTYHIRFYQAVVKQFDHADESGSWSVYLDYDFVETTAPTTSLLAHNDTNLVWEMRTVAFVANDTIHTIKFLPEDDDFDASSAGNQGGLRMGIDNISLVVPKGVESAGNDIPFSVFPNPTNGELTISLDDITSTINVEVIDVCGKLVSSNTFGNSQRYTISLDGPQGIYFVRIQYPDGVWYTAKVTKT